MELIRFLGVSVFGVIIDLLISLGFATLAGAPLWVAATLGFLAAALLNYAVHEAWTFKGGDRDFSVVRSMRYFAVSVVTLLSRIGVIVCLEQAMSNSQLLLLICAAGVSFLVNFILSKFFVFRRSETYER